MRHNTDAQKMDTTLSHPYSLLLPPTVRGLAALPVPISGMLPSEIGRGGATRRASQDSGEIAFRINPNLRTIHSHPRQWTMEAKSVREFRQVRKAPPGG